jgi:hypothetical protein
MKASYLSRAWTPVSADGSVRPPANVVTGLPTDTPTPAGASVEAAAGGPRLGIPTAAQSPQADARRSACPLSARGDILGETVRVLRDVSGWRGLIREYGQLQRLEGHTPQSRGRRFNEMIATLFRCWDIRAVADLHQKTGEIDVAFTLDGVWYVLEAKWEDAKADAGHIAKLQKRVRQRLAGTY